MKRETKLFKNTMIMALGTFMPKFVGIITLPILTECLTKQEYGTYDLLLILISLILPIATLQIQSAAFRFLIENRDNKEELKKIISSILTFTYLISILVLIILFFILLMFDYNLVLCFNICLYFFSDMVLQSMQQISRGLGFNKRYSTAAIIVSVTNMVFLFILLKCFKCGLYGVLFSITIANSAAAVFLFLKNKVYSLYSVRFCSAFVTKKMLKYSWPMIPNNLSSWIMTLSDRLILVLYWGVGINAVYAVAKKIPNLLAAVQSTFSLAWQENASLSANDLDIDEYYGKMFDIIFSLSASVVFVLISTAPYLFELLIRGDYGSAYYQMPMLFMGIFFSVIASFLGGIYIADMRTKNIGISTAVAAGINLFIDILLIPVIGMWAASLSTMISYLFLVIYRMIDLNKTHKIRYRRFKIFVITSILAVLCIISYINVKELNYVNCLIGIFCAFIVNKINIIRILNVVKNKLK